MCGDIDVSALLLGSDGQVRSDDDFVFYNAPVAADGAVRLLGKRSDDEAAEDSVTEDLGSLPADVEARRPSGSLCTTSPGRRCCTRRRCSSRTAAWTTGSRRGCSPS